MSDAQLILMKLVESDSRYKMDAYLFVRDGLTYAQDVLHVGADEEEVESSPETESEKHLTGQQLCEALRKYALDQYGYMAKTVLNSWGLTSTSDFGEVVYNMIGEKLMKKSESDQREDFNDIFDFETAFQQNFDISLPD
ncbi:MAG: hypothetical protein CMJ81_19135 [Planctomycetaceae bacterium]|nr:hypothetical protein [Planctomycetaceae bacterium]MBP61643.1 hypothetical protein [Planctomycetaceae bacterium]